jgi:lambda repressor-like predicted transcriptional regulator
MSRMSELPVYRRQESGVDLPHALARRLGAAVVQDVLRHYETGVTAAELAERYGVSPTGLTNLLHSQGAAVRSPRGLSPTDVELAERLYASGWLLREIGVELGFSRDAVRRALLQRGVVMRSGYGSANRSKRAQR